MRCVDRDCDSVTLAISPDSLGLHWYLEFLNLGAYEAAESPEQQSRRGRVWQPALDVQHLNGPGAEQGTNGKGIGAESGLKHVGGTERAGVEINCRATYPPEVGDCIKGCEGDVFLRVASLEMGTAYQFRLVRVGVEPQEGEEQGKAACADVVVAFVSCRTAAPPPVPRAPICMKRHPSALTVDCIVPAVNERDLQVLGCVLQWRADSFWSMQWQEVDAKILPGAASRLGASSRCQAVIMGLEGDTEYVLRARSYNALGRSLEASEEVRVRTCDRPAPARIVELLSHVPRSAVLAVEVQDPEGAPAHTLEVEVARPGGWWQTLAGPNCRIMEDLPSTHDLIRKEVESGTRQQRIAGRRRVKLAVHSLFNDSDLRLRVWAVNDVGKSKEASNELLLPSFETPKAVVSVECIGRWATKLEIEWYTQDEDRLPVTACSAEYSLNHFLSDWVPVEAKLCRRRPHGIKGQARWRLLLEGLMPERDYLVRVWTMNAAGGTVGPSSPPGQLRTAGRPEVPQSVRCIAFTATTITMELEVFCERLQAICSDPVTSVTVEKASMIMWEPVETLGADVLVEAVGEPFVVCEEPSVVQGREIAVVRVRREIIIANLIGDTSYCFRVWISNEAGCCPEPSQEIHCRTSARPVAPSDMGLDVLGIHTVVVTWHVPDPKGSPVHGAEFQLTPSPSSRVRCSEVIRCTQGACKWTQVIDGLRPVRECSFRVRARNEVGWSSWSAWFQWSPPVVPEIRRPVAIISTDFDGTRMACVQFETVDCAAAPAALAVVASSASGRRQMAVRCITGSWTATFRALVEEDHDDHFTVRAANSVGWSTEATCQRLERVGSMYEDVAANEQTVQPVFLARPIARSINVLVSMEAARRLKWQRKLEPLAEASSGARSGAARPSSVLEGQQHALSEVLHTLQAVGDLLRQRASGSNPVLVSSWPRRCREHIAVWRSTQNLAGSLPLALAILRLLLEGAAWVEYMDATELRLLWGDITSAAPLSPQAGAWKEWRSKHSTWEHTFQKRLLETWPNAFVTAMHMLGAADGNGDLYPFMWKSTTDLETFLDFHDDIERQCRAIEQSLESLRFTLPANMPGNEVALSIYELDGVLSLTAVTEFLGMGRAYHVGVEVYWLEWSFGWSEVGSGVFPHPIGGCSLGTFVGRVPLGQTHCSVEEVTSILGQLRSEYGGQSYDVLRRNCVHFSMDLVQRLGVPEPPPWVGSLAVVARSFAQWLDGVPTPEACFFADDEARRACGEDKALQLPVAAGDDVDADSRSSGIPPTCQDPKPNTESSVWSWAHEYMADRLCRARIARRSLTQSNKSQEAGLREGRSSVTASDASTLSPHSSEDTPSCASLASTPRSDARGDGRDGDASASPAPAGRRWPGAPRWGLLRGVPSSAGMP